MKNIVTLICMIIVLASLGMAWYGLAVLINYLVIIYSMSIALIFLFFTYISILMVGFFKL